MAYPEQIYENVVICQGDKAVAEVKFSGSYRKLYFLENTTLANVKTLGDTLTTNFTDPTGNKLFQCFKGTTIEGLAIQEFFIRTVDQEGDATGTVLAYS